MAGMFTCATSSIVFLGCLVIGCVVSQPLTSGKECSPGLDHEFKLYEDIRRRLVRHDADIAEMQQRLTQKEADITEMRSRYVSDIADINTRHDADIAQLQQSMANMAGPTASGTGI
jgi:hypothetical protein